MRITVKVKAGAGRNEVKQTADNYYEVKVTAVPEKGKANEKVIELLAKHLNFPKSKLEIVSGHTYKEKVIEINL